MPLSNPTERTEQHTRTYDFRGYERTDGLWDIEARLMDVKTYSFRNEFRGEIAPGDPVHDMWIRLTITEDFEVKEIEVVTDQSPFAICPAVAPNFQRIVGTKIGMGWKGQIRKLLAGSEGCTHLVENAGLHGHRRLSGTLSEIDQEARATPGRPETLLAEHLSRLQQRR